jgi:hypothetical protein
VILSFDYSQIELRIAAWLSGDPGLMEIFKRGGDAHSEVASRVFHVRPEDVSYEQRRRAKVINFGILYGMGVTSLQQSLQTRAKRRKNFIINILRRSRGLRRTSMQSNYCREKNGYTKTYFGRRRYFDGIKSPIPYVRGRGAHGDQCADAGHAGRHREARDGADLIILKSKTYTMVRICCSRSMTNSCLKSRRAEQEALAPKIKEIMENIVPEKERFGIPFLAEGKMGKNWGDMENSKSMMLVVVGKNKKKGSRRAQVGEGEWRRFGRARIDRRSFWRHAELFCCEALWRGSEAMSF